MTFKRYRILQSQQPLMTCRCTLLIQAMGLEGDPFSCHSSEYTVSPIAYTQNEWPDCMQSNGNQDVEDTLFKIHSRIVIRIHRSAICTQSNSTVLSTPLFSGLKCLLVFQITLCSQVRCPPKVVTWSSEAFSKSHFDYFGKHWRSLGFRDLRHVFLQFRHLSSK